MTLTRRAIQFVIECVAGALLAGVILGAAVPLLSRRGLMPASPWDGLIVWGTIALLIAAATLRPKGALRRRD